ncbi:hypothetical protein [Marinobacterium stanieri]|uniref:Uncharacterized protein n=1 Tax=Marinobacterium stanieri TaxID=49186 RepID=A0A1N6W6T0_9GAMM|nr:hypothetical protein [Marinobacterium stanieri]SIQ85692.1 hypothetical protein SAMN05421647_1109 [Marinobacterium stanieri]
MSRIKTVTAALLLSVAAVNAHADIRLNGGQTLISKGDPLSDIHEHIKPTRSYRGAACNKV